MKPLTQLVAVGAGSLNQQGGLGEILIQLLDRQAKLEVFSAARSYVPMTSSLTLKLLQEVTTLKQLKLNYCDSISNVGYMI